MFIPDPMEPLATLSPPYLGSLSAFSAKSFTSTAALVEAVLVLVTDQLGLRTSFLTEITPAQNRNLIVAVHRQPDGCEIIPGSELPLAQTFCGIITGMHEPAPLLINNTHTDPTFRLHPAATNAPEIGSFIGVPLVLGGGDFFGTLCAIDPEPQALSIQQADMLMVLGRIIATQIERDREAATRTKAEAEQARLYRVAQDALREREALLAIASHELKNPLAALLGYAHLLQRRMRRNTTSEERDQHAVQTIVAQAERLNRLLTDLLDVSRLENDQFVIERMPLDLSTLLHTIKEELEPTLRGHSITIQDADSPLMILGDEERLAQVVRNLIGNAIKYSPHGGAIRMVIDAQDEQARVSFQDDGIGIPQDALPNLFQRFYRASNTAQHGITGFGIGLYVVKEIVTRHGGTISVASVEGEGTTVTLHMPLLAT